jgi:hypothetical protein
MEKSQDLFSTSDLDLTAYLLTLNFRFAQPPQLPAPHKRVIFSFPKSQKLEQACIEFLNRQAQVEPVSFAECLRSIRTQAQELRRG